jgi:hypothetical protein
MHRTVGLTSILRKWNILLYDVLEILIIFEIVSCFEIRLSVLTHSAAAIYPSISGLVEVVPTELDHGGVVNELVKAVQTESVQIVVYVNYFPHF